MAHVAKYAKSACGHMINHYNRDKEKECNRSNENIDKERTKDNYNLMQRQETPQEYLKERTSELYCLNRADVKVMADYVVTLPKDYVGSSQEFFVHTTDFLNNRYGAENCLGAFVHMDETQPHLHYSFIPVTKDNNPEHEQEEKICAKEVLTKQDLKTFHPDLQSYLREKMPDREINIYSETKEKTKNASLERYKLERELETLKKQQEKNLEKERELNKQQRELERKQIDVKSREKDVSEREHRLDKLEARNKEVDRYFKHRDDYCERNGLTQNMYEKECLMSRYTGNLKPYPEIANPTLPREEREQLAQSYNEQQRQEHTHERGHAHEHAEPTHEPTHEMPSMGR